MYSTFKYFVFVIETDVLCKMAIKGHDLNLFYLSLFKASPPQPAFGSPAAGAGGGGGGGGLGFGSVASFSNPIGQSPFGSPPQQQGSSAGPFGAGSPAASTGGGFGT